MPHFHRHATPATNNNNNLVLQQQNLGAPIPLQPGVPVTGYQQTTLVPVQQTTVVQTTGYSAGAPFVQAPLVQQPLYLNKEISTTGITTQMSAASLAGVPHQTIVRPAIIEEIVRTDTLVQVQPIVHREIDQQRVHHVEQHITERAAPAMGGTVKLAPIVQETVRTNVIEEVQPIIHREVATRQVERVEEHLTEHINAPAVHTTGAALGAGVHSTIAKPAIIDERVRTDRLVEVQPIVHREIEQPRVHHVERHITEAPAPSMAGVVKMAPVVQQTVRTNVIEEVQPVIHREIATRQVERVEEHLTERVVAPTQHTREVQSLDSNVALQKPVLVQTTVQPGFSAGGPIPTNANIARPL
eukprot:TRINITY_DN53_c0_g1_i2.p1 TRINITY_DN53_c0_g1~~TRINITY_DN53_c0_g1_i2.p1  ORF type:complete len:382 (-),score=98.85 TRINITY_DN53_c0_g1_i2:48-1118(-)